jgi:hypothetical protein
MRVSTLLYALLLSLGTASALAQTVPTGTISGRVVDPDGLPLSGTVVTATSSALQGTRSTSSSDHGNYIVPFLPAGRYDVVFEQAGFASNRRTVRVQVAEAVTVNIQMSLGGLSETITVPALTDFAATPPVGVSYGADLIDTLPISRDINGPVLLAPGTTATGPGASVTFGGAMSYEGLFLLNGVVLNETLRNQARPLVIEDAIEEVRILTSNISAEYGRFSGGVANTITRSGGNVFSGSFRTTFNNDSWRSLTPYEREHAIKPTNMMVPTHEATSGGPVFRDKLWFFAAARFEKNKTSQTTRYTNLAYDEEERDRRFEGKGTWLVRSGHTVRGSYSGRNLALPNVATGTVMDLASVSARRDVDRLTSANYTGVITSRLFVEGQYSQRQYRIVGFGSQFTDLVRGTMILDRSRDGARWNSPTFCGVCGPDGSETAEARERSRQGFLLLVHAHAGRPPYGLRRRRVRRSLAKQQLAVGQWIPPDRDQHDHSRRRDESVSGDSGRDEPLPGIGRLHPVEPDLCLERRQPSAHLFGFPERYLGREPALVLRPRPPVGSHGRERSGPKGRE